MKQPYQAPSFHLLPGVPGMTDEVFRRQPANTRRTQKGNPMHFIEDATAVERTLIDRAAQSLSPINGSIELTPICNMNCEICYVRLTSAEVTRQGRLRTLCRTCAASALLETGRYDGTPDYMCCYTAHTFRLLLDEVSALAREQKA